MIFHHSRFFVETKAPKPNAALLLFSIASCAYNGFFVSWLLNPTLPTCTPLRAKPGILRSWQ